MDNNTYMENRQVKERILVSGCKGCRHFYTQRLYFTCSSLGMDDRRLYMIGDRDRHHNVWVARPSYR
ncbi:MAG: hypothetical protein KHX42_05940 [Prevotella sp.]|nr:hypothetical protein [Prevotella sp.]